MELITYLIYFFAGVLQDIAVTIYYRLLHGRHPVAVAIASFVLTVINMLILYNILVSLDPSQSILLIVVFGIGNALGAYLTIKFYPEPK